ncbi:MAG: hydroxymethylbilane synthase [Myxococcales bacterium]|jgi:hydroxymethylbilane synthase|nr:hydroxymethylbilane synthase [Myxococcales bacterium]
MTFGDEAVLRIGTRRSQLAMWQANTVAAQLRQHFPALRVVLVPVATTGDRDKTTALSNFARPGIFTREIEQGLIDRHFDIAVHSYKDVATQYPEALDIGAVLERETPNDAFLSRHKTPLHALKPGSVVGTSSLRRRAMLLHARPDLRIVPLRGNVPTRLRAVGISPAESTAESLGAITESTESPGATAAPLLDATILALAGLRRLGYAEHAAETLKAPAFVPAPAQGAIAVQIRRDDETTRQKIQPLNHPATRAATDAERLFMRLMEGGCQLPLGAHAHITPSGDMRMTAAVLTLDGAQRIDGTCEAATPDELAHALFAQMQRAGADAVLREVRRHLESTP